MRLTTGETVSVAAEWLDEVAPEWFTSVDADSLDIYDPRNCILGQVFADKVPDQHRHLNGYDWALWNVKPQIPSDAQPAFLVMDYDYIMLRNAWLREVEERINATAGV